jgi:beta-keto acid cleavage enzyme
VVHSLGGAGIAVEAGVWSVADVQVLARAVEEDALARLPLRILIEVSGEPADAAPRVAGDILRALGGSAVHGIPRLLHGEGEGCWPLVAQAAREGLPTRIGLEDTTAGPDGKPVSGNAELVRLALEILRP